MKPPAVTSLANSRIKKAAKLRRGRERRARNRMLVSGRRELARLLASGRPLETVYFDHEALELPERSSRATPGADEDLPGDEASAAELLAALALRADPVPCSPEVLAKLTFRDDPEVPLVVETFLPWV